MSSPEQSLPALIEDYADREAGDSARVLTGRLARAGAGDREVLWFLLAGDLAELGRHDQSAKLYRELSRSRTLGPAAFVGLARVRSEAGANARLVEEARLAPWERFPSEEFAEAAYRVAGACLALRRFGEASRWAEAVPEASSFHAFARYLLAQSEFGAGRYAGALRAAAPILRGPNSALKARTAILLGDMLTEIGRYDDARALLSWPDERSRFRERAQRDREIAEFLAAIADGRLEQAERLSASIHARLREDFVGNRRRPNVWSERRRWAARRAENALARAQGWTLGRLGRLVWSSLPPVALYQALRPRRAQERAGEATAEYPAEQAGAELRELAYRLDLELARAHLEAAR